MSPRATPEFEAEVGLEPEQELLGVQEKTEQVEQRLRRLRHAPDATAQPKRAPVEEQHGAYRTASSTDAALDEAQDKLVQLQIEEAVLREATARRSVWYGRTWWWLVPFSSYVAVVAAMAIWLGGPFAAPVAILLPLGLLAYWAIGKIEPAPNGRARK
ncbi:MAG: hypothetical protein U0271_15290 [Polyangiaceae bacterium]